MGEEREGGEEEREERTKESEMIVLRPAAIFAVDRGRLMMGLGVGRDALLDADRGVHFVRILPTALVLSNKL